MDTERQPRKWVGRVTRYACPVWIWMSVSFHLHFSKPDKPDKLELLISEIQISNVQCNVCVCVCECARAVYRVYVTISFRVLRASPIASSLMLLLLEVHAFIFNHKKQSTQDKKHSTTEKNNRNNNNLITVFSISNQLLISLRIGMMQISVFRKINKNYIYYDYSYKNNQISPCLWIPIIIIKDWCTLFLVKPQSQHKNTVIAWDTKT